jgi:transcriptional regulator GlxA family with amidase domain
MRIAIALFEGFTATDAIGPYEVLSRLPGAQLAFVASRSGLTRSDTGFLTVDTQPLDAMPTPDVLVMPGGPNRHLPLTDAALIDWLRAADRTSTWTASVCTGAYVLGAAGLLQGKRAVTHWMDVDGLAGYGAEAVDARYVFDGKLVTAAGVSSGYDMALALAARIAGDTVAQAIQLGIEYDPQPPFRAGHPRSAPPAVVAMVRAQAGAA